MRIVERGMCMEDAPRGGVLCFLFPFFPLQCTLSTRRLWILVSLYWSTRAIGYYQTKAVSVVVLKQESIDRRSNEHKAWHALLRITWKHDETYDTIRERTWIAGRHPLGRFPPHPRTNRRNGNEEHRSDPTQDEREKDDGFFVREMAL